jgi:hypothetical protein
MEAQATANALPLTTCATRGTDPDRFDIHRKHNWRPAFGADASSNCPCGSGCFALTDEVNSRSGAVSGLR